MKKIANQHGDVCLEIVKSIPNNAKKLVYCEGFVLEKGEGVHTHTIKSKLGVDNPQNDLIKLKQVCGDIEIYSLNDTMYIKVKRDKSVYIDHEEHGQQELKKGIYKKHIEREYDYEANEERKVID